MERDLLLQEKEKLYKEMKDILARQVHVHITANLGARHSGSPFVNVLCFRRLRLY